MYISMSASDFPASEARYARGKPHTHLKALCCWPSNGMNAGYKFSKVRYGHVAGVAARYTPHKRQCDT